MRTRTILLVADRTAAEPHVLEAICTRAAQAPTAVTLLVPASRPRGGWTWDEASARGQARRRMRTVATSLRHAGISVATVLGDFSPLEAIRDEMRRDTYDEIVISTLPTRVSRWLRTDLLTRVAREFPVQVSHVQLETGLVEVSPGVSRSSAA
ncbi:MAG: universal stress protein [Actinomycetota bacterium]